MASLPLARLLVPAELPALPPNSETIDMALLNGLPHAIQLGAVATALLIAPSGLAVDWRDGDATRQISSSDDGFNPPDPTAPLDPIARTPARLLIRQTGGGLLGVVPLVAGLTARLPLGEGQLGLALELTIRSWDLRAGNLRGPGDYGGRIGIAWRRTDLGATHFEPPPVHPMIVLRTPPPVPPTETPPPIVLLPGVVYLQPLDLMVSELGLNFRALRLRQVRGFAP